MLHFESFCQKNSFSYCTGIGFNINKSSAILPNYKTQKYGFGEGTILNLAYSHYPDSSHVIVGFELQTIKGKNVIKLLNKNSIENLNAEVRNVSNQLILKTGYWWKYKKIHFEINTGVILPYNNYCLHTIHQKDSVGNTIIKSEFKHYFSLGFNGKLLVAYPIQKNISIFTTLNLNLLNAKVKSSEIKSFSNYKYETIETAFPDVADREVNYLKNIEDIKNNETVLPRLFNKNMASDEFSYKESYSNWGLSFGFKFSF